MRFLLPIFAVFFTLTLVSRTVSSVQHFYTSDLVSHEHAHEHSEHGPDQAHSSASSEHSSAPTGHSHSHTHVLIEYAAWVDTNSALKTHIVAPQSIFSSAVENIYFFNFLSRIFRPPIA